MGYPVYYEGEMHVTPALTEDDATALLEIANLDQTERSCGIFEAIKRSAEPDLPYHSGLLRISDDRSLILPEDDESRHGVRMWLALLIEHFLKPRGYVLRGEVAWIAGDDNEDRGRIYVQDNQMEAVDDVILNAGPSWSPKPFANEHMKRAVERLLDSADNTGCSFDLTVVAADTLQELRSLFERL